MHVAAPSLSTTAGAPSFRLDYGPEIEPALALLTRRIEAAPVLASRLNARWLAIQLLAQDEAAIFSLQALPEGAPICALAQAAAARLETAYGDDSDILLAERRYRWIHAVAADTIHELAPDEPSRSDRIDRIVTHRILGLPIFLVAMWIVFKLTTDAAAPLVDWIAAVIDGPVTGWTVAVLASVGLSDGWLAGLLVDGVIAGVGGVLAFVPVLGLLYLALALLEDSGYMARVAFLMDRLMRPFGLHGRSFLPMIVGFGCTVPAIYATRTLERPRDRLLTALLVPFMSCSARLPVYVLFAAIFFPTHAGAAIFFLYLLGIAVAVVIGLILQRTLPHAEESGLFLLELPPYRLPTLDTIGRQAWQRVRAFLRKAWSVILFMSVLVWALMSVQVDVAGGRVAPAASVDQSLFARVAQATAPAFAPLGFGSWQATGSLITGVVAKEVIVSSLAQTYGMAANVAPARQLNLLEDGLEIGRGLGEAFVGVAAAVASIFSITLPVTPAPDAPSSTMAIIQQSFAVSSGGHGAAAGLAFMVFVLLYTPCMVAAAALRHEFGTRWMWASIIGQFALAWLAALVTFQGGRLLGF